MARGGMDAVVARSDTERRRPVFKRKGAGAAKDPASGAGIGETPNTPNTPNTPPARVSLDDLAARIAALEARCDAYDAQHGDDEMDEAVALDVAPAADPDADRDDDAEEYA